MSFKKIKKASLTELFVRQIEDMILSGEFKIGDRLPPERELAAQMGVSRPVIAAGLLELEKLGFVEIHPRQGAFVSDYRRKGTTETLAVIMRFHGGSMRKQEITSLMQVRIPLERLCMELVIQNAADEELAALAPLSERFHTVTTEEEAGEAAFRFHHELAAISGNHLLPLLYHSFKPESMYLWTNHCYQHGIEAFCRRKRELYKSILNRDLESALALTPGEIPGWVDQTTGENADRFYRRE